MGEQKCLHYTVYSTHLSSIDGSVMHLTCSQGCPSALPTLYLRLIDTCSRLLIRLTAAKERERERWGLRIYSICIRSGPIETNGTVVGCQSHYKRMVGG